MTKEELIKKIDAEIAKLSDNASQMCEEYEGYRLACKDISDVFQEIAKEIQSSLSSDLDVAAHRYAWEKQEHHIDFDGDEYLDYGPRYDAFKAGAKWDAAQGVSMLGRVGIYGVDVESITKELREAGFNLGEEIILQIRKKQ